jgi:hypothetical protein
LLYKKQNPRHHRLDGTGGFVAYLLIRLWAFWETDVFRFYNGRNLLRIAGKPKVEDTIVHKLLPSQKKITLCYQREGTILSWVIPEYEFFGFKTLCRR